MLTMIATVLWDQDIHLLHLIIYMIGQGRCTLRVLVQITLAYQNIGSLVLEACHGSELLNNSIQHKLMFEQGNE